MRGFRSVIAGGGLADVVLPVAVLMGFTTALAALAAWRFRYDEVKVSFT